MNWLGRDGAALDLIFGYKKAFFRAVETSPSCDKDEGGFLTIRNSVSGRKDNGWWNLGGILLADALTFIFTILILWVMQQPRQKRMVKVGSARCVQHIRRRSGNCTGRTYFLMLLYVQGVEGHGLGDLVSEPPLQNVPSFHGFEGDMSHSSFGGGGSLGNAEEATWEPANPRDSVDFQVEDFMSLMALGTHEAHDPRDGIGRTESVVDMPDAATTPQMDDEEDGDPDETTSEDGYDSSRGYHEGLESDSGGSQAAEQDGNMNIPADPGGPYEVDEGNQETDWKHLFQFRRNHLQRHCFLRWNTHYNLVNNIANTWEVSKSSILQILHVTSVVEGIPDNARKVIVIVQNDDPSFDARLHVLVDVVWHTLVHFVEGPQIHRRVLRFRSLMTRRSMLTVSEVGGYCQDQNDRCLVRLNGETIPLQDVRNYNIRSGFYVRIDVPPIEQCRESVGGGPNGSVGGSSYGLSLL